MPLHNCRPCLFTTVSVLCTYLLHCTATNNKISFVYCKLARICTKIVACKQHWFTVSSGYGHISLGSSKMTVEASSRHSPCQAPAAAPVAVSPTTRFLLETMVCCRLVHMWLRLLLLSGHSSVWQLAYCSTENCTAVACSHTCTQDCILQLKWCCTNCCSGAAPTAAGIEHWHACCCVWSQSCSKQVHHHFTISIISPCTCFTGTCGVLCCCSLKHIVSDAAAHHHLLGSQDINQMPDVVVLAALSRTSFA